MPALSGMLPSPFAPAGYNRGRSNFDRTHVLNINGVYEFPFGKNRKYLGASNAVVNGILGGWQLSGVYSFVSGQPLRIMAPGATLGNGRDSRANLVGDPRSTGGTADMWFNTAAFAVPGPMLFGNSGIGILDSPGRHALDTGLMKNFYVTESKYVQFRWEMFNATNHVNLNTPGTTVGTSTFGRILSAGDPRQMQLALKFIF